MCLYKTFIFVNSGYAGWIYNKSKETEHISIIINRNMSSDFIRITCCLQTDLLLILSKM